jgi:hypothetical protein
MSLLATYNAEIFLKPNHQLVVSQESFPYNSCNRIYSSVWDLTFCYILRKCKDGLITGMTGELESAHGPCVYVLFDVITSLVSLDYWGCGCEKVTSLREATLERSGVTSLRDISIGGVT